MNYSVYFLAVHPHAKCNSASNHSNMATNFSNVAQNMFLHRHRCSNMEHFHQPFLWVWLFLCKKSITEAIFESRVQKSTLLSSLTENHCPFTRYSFGFKFFNQKFKNSNSKIFYSVQYSMERNSTKRRLNRP